MTQTITKTTEDQIVGDAFSNRKVKGPPPLIDVLARYKLDYKPNDSRHNHVDDVTGLTGESAVDAATSGKPVIGEVISRAFCKKPLYTVTLAKVLSDNTLRHDFVLTTHNDLEALQWRNELNKNRSFYGSNEVAQIIRREVLPRQWSLTLQVSPNEVHLHCAWSQARALLRTSTPELLKCLHRGYVLSQTDSVYLQSEQVRFTRESTSTCSVSFTSPDKRPITQNADLQTLGVCYLDVNSSFELLADTRSGVIARHPFQDDRLTLPEKFARALWLEGIVLPLKAQTGGKVLVRLTDPELRARLLLSRLKSRIHDRHHGPTSERLPDCGEEIGTLGKSVMHEKRGQYVHDWPEWRSSYLPLTRSPAVKKDEVFAH